MIRATIRANQKCFVLRKPETGGLANNFILVANIVATDGGAAIAAGNGRVVRARLRRREILLRDRFQGKARRAARQIARSISSSTKSSARKASGSTASRSRRKIAPRIGADVALAKRAAKLAKADLICEMVGEFPELQGLMGNIMRRRRARRSRRRGDRGPLQAARPERPHSDRALSHRRRARRQARHPRRFLRDRREARPAARIPTPCGAPRSVSSELCSKTHCICGCADATRGSAIAVRDEHPRIACRSRPRQTQLSAGRWTLEPRNHRRSSRLLRRPPESLSARQGRAARPHRRRLRLPGQDDLLLDRAPRRGARPLSRYRRRRQSAHRLSPGREYPARRGKEGGRGEAASYQRPSGPNISSPRKRKPCRRCSPRRPRRAMPSPSRISKPPCRRCRICARRSMPSSTRSRSTETTRAAAAQPAAPSLNGLRARVHEVADFLQDRRILSAGTVPLPEDHDAFGSPRSDHVRPD